MGAVLWYPLREAASHLGDVSREKPMTVDLSVYAQSLTKKPMKGMLTGGYDFKLVFPA